MSVHDGLYDPADERDSCGVGMIVRIDGSIGHDIVEYGLSTLENLAHRGAENADGRTGDGSGITLQIPHEFILKCGIPVPEAGRYGTGLIFLPKDEARREICLEAFRDECRRMGLSLIAERPVPVDHSVPGRMALETEPYILQVFISSYDSQETLERKLFLLRKHSERDIGDNEFYICSLSTRTIVYKGMLTPGQMRHYYLDLTDEDLKSSIAMVHSRFSTNTVPMWKLAQPFRMLCHNGEINTIKANRSWMQARESNLGNREFPDIDDIAPIVQPGMSDSSSLDNVFEFLTLSGMSLPNAMTAMIPESWNSRNPIPDSLKAYYEYNSIFMEPWDGPAAVLFTDGRLAGGMLDRNGLRPVRYTMADDGLFILASEAGVIPVDNSSVKETGRISPGKMMLIDTAEGRVLSDWDIKSTLSYAYPYRDWLDKNRIDLADVSSGRVVDRSVSDADKMKGLFLYSKEDIDKIIIPSVMNLKEPVSASGCDTPLPILSDMPQLFFNYFRQSFAQVTNPAIDPIREELVMSIMGYIGPVANNILSPAPENCHIVKVRHPIITNRELDLLKNLRYRGFSTEVVPMVFDVSEGPDGLEKALQEICRKADEIVDEGESYIILSDRMADSTHAPIPSLLAVSAVHQHLVENRKRLQTGIIVESGEPREVEHIALLFAYGVNLVNPYLVYEEIEELCNSGAIPYDADTAEERYIHVFEKGLMKIMSKMGISTIRSYRGSCLFEAIGLDKDMCQKYLFGTSSVLGGIGLKDIAEDIIANHSSVYNSDSSALTDRGVYSHHPGGERHAWSPETVKLLHASSADPDIYPAFAERADLGDGLFFIRDLMEEGKLKSRVEVEDVEPVSDIVRRFVIEAMSFGAISKEAHETMALAANRIHAKSNCGEGGEDPSRNVPVDGKDICSHVRQVASGRFGVNTEYLANAEELQIKCAQGAKPGEGGQLMGFKVDKVIAATRHTLPGVTLISPPPHHDIYSIEDLKQLILDLRCVNPKACISVKLVSETGVGTVASGVAKAGADKILISGADGGTGAAPMSSMRYAGLPWEIGLAEAQQSLVSNGFRDRVILQVDGQLKTGRDVIMAALLGADEFGFASSILVSMGCVMCRKCQTNTCPVGIATQDPERRAKFKGTPENVINYLESIANDVRERLAAMGFRSLGEIIGRVDLIRTRKVFGRASSLDISPLLFVEEGARCFRSAHADDMGKCIDSDIIGSRISQIEAGNEISCSYGIRNTDRSVGAMLSGELQRRGLILRDDTIRVDFTGDAGQSFGAFLSKGISFHLEGQANDFVGKGLSGGRISISRKDSNPQDVLAGNTVLYGATAGELYIAGRVGERFCVRNSGAVAVAEGAGDHCCEYMTGGRVVVLGRCGRNFAAGMSAGIAYVLNDDGDFDRHCNMDMVELELLDDPEDRKELKKIIEKHHRYTGSKIAKSLLTDWENSCKRFIKVIPVGYKMLLKDESN